jgi:hypothetical protein
MDCGASGIMGKLSIVLVKELQCEIAEIAAGEPVVL